MHLAWFELTGFRSYRNLRWEPDEGVNVLVGPNGAGKTNLLEGVAYLGTLRSLRGVPDEALIAQDADTAILRGEVRRRDSSADIGIEIPRGRRRRVLVNGNRPARASEMAGHIRIVAFLPEDLDIIKRGPGHRREFFDETAVQLWPAAYVDRRDYERALRQRNALLKARTVDSFTLDVWDDRVSEAGARLMQRRVETIRALMSSFRNRYRALSGADESVEIRYKSTWGGEFDGAGTTATFRDDLLRALQASRREDFDRRVTTVGPHRDDALFFLGGLPARTSASQGEQRTLALSLRLAAHDAIGATVGEPAVLLLDDVFSELDVERSAALVRVLPEAQTFITTARIEDVPVDGRRWDVHDGRVQ